MEVKKMEDNKRFQVAFGPMTAEEKQYLIVHGLAKMGEDGELYGEPETVVESESGDGSSDGSLLQLEDMTMTPRRSQRISAKYNTPLRSLTNSPQVNGNQNQEDKFVEIPIHSPVLAHSPEPAVESDDNKENESFIEKFQELEIKIPDATIYQEDITATPTKRILKISSKNNTPLQNKNENEGIAADEDGLELDPFKTPENDEIPIPRRSARIASKNNTPQQINESIDNFATPFVNRINNLDGQTPIRQMDTNITPRRSARIASKNNTPFPFTNIRLETIADDSILQVKNRTCSPQKPRTPRMKNLTPRPKLFMDDEYKSGMNQEFAQDEDNFELQEVEAETIDEADNNTNEVYESSFLQMEYTAYDESSPLNKTFDFEDKNKTIEDINNDDEKENLNEINAELMQNENDLMRFDDAERDSEKDTIVNVNDNGIGIGAMILHLENKAIQSPSVNVQVQPTPDKSVINDSVKESPKIVAAELIQKSDLSVEFAGICETSFDNDSSLSFIQHEQELKNSSQTKAPTPLKAQTPLKTPIKSQVNDVNDEVKYIPKILAGKKSSLFPSPLMLKPNRVAALRNKGMPSPSPPRPMNLPKGVKAGMPTPRSAPIPKRPLRAATPKVMQSSTPRAQSNTPRVNQNNTPRVIQQSTTPKDMPSSSSTTPKRSAHTGCFFSPVKQNTFGMKTTLKNKSISLASKSSTGPKPPVSAAAAASNGRGIPSPLVKSQSTIPKPSSIPNRILFNSKMVNSPVANYIYSSPTPAKLEIARPKAINTIEKKKIVSKIPLFFSKSNENISPTSSMSTARKSTVSQFSTKIPMPMSENVQKKPEKTLRPVYYQSGTKTPNPSRLNSMPIIQKHFGMHNESGNCSIVQREEADKKFIPSRLKTPISYSHKK